MLLGHYAVALAAKRAAPRASVGWLFFGAQFADLLWPLLLFAGIERVEIRAGATAFNPLEFTHYPVSHSLVALIGWGVLVGGIYYLLRHQAPEAFMVGLLVPSHWVLDAIVHVPDLPILPGLDLRIGFSLWNAVPATWIVELGLILAGSLLYSTFTRAKDAIGRWAFIAFVVVLTGIWVSTALGPPPPGVTALAFSALALWLTVPWGAWFDRHREPVSG